MSTDLEAKEAAVHREGPTTAQEARREQGEPHPQRPQADECGEASDVDCAVPVQLCGGGGVEHADAHRRDLHPAERLQETHETSRADGGGGDHRAHVQGGARQAEHCRAKSRQNSEIEIIILWLISAFHATNLATIQNGIIKRCTASLS